MTDGNVRSLKKILVNLLVTLVVGVGYFYFKLPAVNLHSPELYRFVFFLSFCYCVVAIITSGIWRIRDKHDFLTSVKHHCLVPLILCAALIVIYFVGWLLSSVILRSAAYKELLQVQPGDFAQEIEEISFDQIPMLDKDSAEKLGDRKLGELADMVSQFEVSDQYAQINYQDRPVRVTPLEYGDIIKWFNNRKNGIPAYILLDMVTQNAEVVRLSEGMKYTLDEHFSRYLYRHLRFRYPTYMFNTPIFEIDEEGTPYWVCPKLEKTIGLFGGTDINGVVLVNAVNGACEYYAADNVPSWIDRVYSADLIVEQYDYHGKYQNGFLNSIFGQKGVTVTTEGYNYIAMNDDVYVYTGITSVGGDASNVGFILTNQRTKETKYYTGAGATEYSAMSSAEGVVQHLNYRATFPLLLNIQGEPTYFMALKDYAGLVKMYAMVNVQQYQIVATGASVAECQQNYGRLLSDNHVTQQPVITEKTVKGTIEEIRSAVIDGNTYYYIKLSARQTYFAVSAAENPLAVILNVGDPVEIRYTDGTDSILPAQSVTR